MDLGHSPSGANLLWMGRGTGVFVSMLAAVVGPTAEVIAVCYDTAYVEPHASELAPAQACRWTRFTSMHCPSWKGLFGADH
jgi:hypothetical protein